MQLPSQNFLAPRGKLALKTSLFVKVKYVSLTEMVPPTKTEDIYRELLKRYREFGYLSPEDALNHDIHLLEDKGKTTGEAILRMYKGTSDETIELIEQYIMARAQIPKPEEEKAQSSTSKNQVQESLGNKRNSVVAR